MGRVASLMFFNTPTRQDKHQPNDRYLNKINERFNHNDPRIHSFDEWIIYLYIEHVKSTDDIMLSMTYVILRGSRHPASWGRVIVLFNDFSILYRL